MLADRYGLPISTSSTSARDAYVGYIRELKQSNQTTAASTYLRRLECCDPGALLEVNGPPG